MTKPGAVLHRATAMLPLPDLLVIGSVVQGSRELFDVLTFQYLSERAIRQQRLADLGVASFIHCPFCLHSSKRIE
jgi:hypothetical protein